MKFGFWQIIIAEEDRYKTAFTSPFRHYELKVMLFGLKNAPSKFQNIMNDIFNPYSTFIIVYINDVLIFSSSIDQPFKHLNSFFNIVKHHENKMVWISNLCFHMIKVFNRVHLSNCRNSNTNFEFVVTTIQVMYFRHG